MVRRGSEGRAGLGGIDAPAPGLPA